MNREILFRGKRLDNGQWVYGFYSNIKGDNGRFHYIKTEKSSIKVDPATVGQYTGLTDVDGDKIYEGDILSVLVFQPKGEYLPREVVIEWNKERASYIGVDINNSEEWWGVNWLKKPIIIGNRWDNPNLLKGGTK